MWLEKKIMVDTEEGKMMFVYIDWEGALWIDPPFIEWDEIKLLKFLDVDGKEI